VRDASRAHNETGWSVQAVATTMTASSEPCRARFDFENDGRDARGRHHGRFKGRATFAANAKHGAAALQLDGRDGYPIVPDHDELDIGAGNFAISRWFTRNEAKKDNLRLLSKYGSGWRGYALWGGNEKIRFDVGSGKGSTRVGVTGTIPKLGEWVHLAVNVEHARRITMYVNGAPAGERALNLTDVGSGADLTIGAGSGLTWTGLIDDVRIYKRLLGDEEIAALAGQ
jgi:hypothetical protein